MYAPRVHFEKGHSKTPLLLLLFYYFYIFLIITIIIIIIIIIKLQFTPLRSYTKIVLTPHPSPPSFNPFLSNPGKHSRNYFQRTLTPHNLKKKEEEKSAFFKSEFHRLCLDLCIMSEMIWLNMSY